MVSVVDGKFTKTQIPSSEPTFFIKGTRDYADDASCEKFAPKTPVVACIFEPLESALPVPCLSCSLGQVAARTEILH
jgi:hypothetical protein